MNAGGPSPMEHGGATALEGLLFRDVFGTPAMRAIFSLPATIEAWLTVEAALAQAQAAIGVIPATAAPAIAAACTLANVDIAVLRDGTALVGYPILPLVRQIARAAGEPAGGYVHWGATTQDIMDTATALQIRAARRLIDGDLERLVTRLCELARAHRATVMAGRTHGQQALPITLGYKLAVFVAELRRHRDRLVAAGARAEMVEFAGAAGTLASVGAQGLEVQAHMAASLDLAVPPIAWHTSRDGVAEFVASLALLGATLAKLAQEVALLQRTEIGEVEEGYLPGRGGSSTMPQKRNPITCEAMIGANSRLRQLVPVMLDAMLHDGERATGPWHAEWLALPEACILAHGLVHQADALLASLVVKPEAMARNLALSGGLLNAEAVMMVLAEAIGRQQAHDEVYAAAMRALATGEPFIEELLGQPGVAAHLDRAAIERVLAPAAYLGLATTMVDRVLAGEADR